MFDPALSCKMDYLFQLLSVEIAVLSEIGRLLDVNLIFVQSLNISLIGAVCSLVYVPLNNMIIKWIVSVA